MQLYSALHLCSHICLRRLVFLHRLSALLLGNILVFFVHILSGFVDTVFCSHGLAKFSILADKRIFIHPGLTIEKQLGIPANSDKRADFMGIEIKTKTDTSLQTLFSRVPSRFISCADRKEFLLRHGTHDPKKNCPTIYSTVSSKQNLVLVLLVF